MARRSHARTALAVLACAVLLAGLGVLGFLVVNGDLGQADQVASVVGATVTVVMGAAGLLAWVRPRTGRPADAPVGSADRLRDYLGRRAKLPLIGELAADGLALRVHPALTPGEGTGGTGAASELPTFVRRDKQSEVEAWFRQAARDGGMVYLVGDSAVGKTRLLFEMARRVLPDFRVITPSFGDGELVADVAQATFGLPKLIVWLDELHKFLRGPHLKDGFAPITAESVRALLAGPTPVVIVGSMWPEHLAELTEVTEDSAPGAGSPGARRRDRFPEAVDVLRQGREFVVTTFSDAERESAEQVAMRDPRIGVALRDRDFNVTEVLAGVPELIRRYERGTAEARAVLEAAVDLGRLGVNGALPEHLLRATARGYLTRVWPDDTWFPPALAELARQDRATALLLPEPAADRRSVAGYRVADYVLQRLSAERRGRTVPALLWQAVIDHVAAPDDLSRVADAADGRALYGIVPALLGAAAERGDASARTHLEAIAAWQSGTLRTESDEGASALRYLLWTRGDRGTLERLAADDSSARFYFHELLVDSENIAELRARAADDYSAALGLLDVLAARGTDAEMREIADGPDPDGNIAYAYSELLALRGEIDELRRRVEAGREGETQYLRLLRARGDDAEIERLAAESGPMRREMLDRWVSRGELGRLRAAADTPDGWAARKRLAAVLGDRDELDELRRRADRRSDPDPDASERLHAILVARGEITELTARADAGDEAAATALAELLVRRGDVGALRGRAAGGDETALESLVGVLVIRGDHEGVVALPVAGTGIALRVAEYLARRGDFEELERRARSGDDNAAGVLADVLAGRADVDGLRDLAEHVEGARDTLVDVLALRGDLVALARRAAVDEEARTRLVELLSDRGDAEGLREWAARGDERAVARLAGLLRRRGEVEQLRGLADQVGGSASVELATVLLLRGRHQDLRERADAGDTAARKVLADHQAATGAISELTRRGLRHRAARGHERAASRLIGLLSARGDVTELDERAKAGDEDAADALADMYVARGDLARLKELADRAAGADRYYPPAWTYAEVLAARGHLAELAQRADGGCTAAQSLRVERAAAAGDLGELARLADHGDEDAGEALTARLVALGDSAALRRRAAAGDTDAKDGLARVGVANGEYTLATQLIAESEELPSWTYDFLVDRGEFELLRATSERTGSLDALQVFLTFVARDDLDPVRAAAAAGTTGAADELVATLLARQEIDEVHRLADRDDRSYDSALADALADRRDLALLESLARSGNGAAAVRLATVLDALGTITDHDDLAAAASAVDERLAETLVARADWARLEKLATGEGHPAARAAFVDVCVLRPDHGWLRSQGTGDFTCGYQLSNALMYRGDLDELRSCADDGVRYADDVLARVLRARGLVDELRSRAPRDDQAAEQLAVWQAAQGDAEAVCRSIDAGVAPAAGQLALLLDAQGRRDAAADLRRYGMRPGVPAAVEAIVDA